MPSDTAYVDFGEDHYQHACAVEGAVSCPGGENCIFDGDVTVTDGRFTSKLTNYSCSHWICPQSLAERLSAVTGYSHDSGTCHSVSLVKIETKAGSGR